MSPFNLDEYEPVEDRLRAFWEEHPHGRVITELAHIGADGYIVKASVFREQYLTNMEWNDHPAATGYAQEAVTERGVNSTSALENCETSAIGRALANLGYAAKGKRPSREEMSKASGGSSSGESITPPASSSQRQQGTPPEETSGEGAGEAGDGGEPLRGRADAPVPATNESATEEDWATATKNGLTASKAKAIAKGLGITVTSAVDLTRSDFAQVINKYLEMQAAKK